MHTRGSRGFTLIELLVVIAIIGVLAGIILVFVNRSRAKARDARIRETLSNVRIAATDEQSESGTFDGVCSEASNKAYIAIQGLVEAEGLQDTEYACSSGTDGFAVSFPLNAESGNWCVDAQGRAGVSDTPVSSIVCPALHGETPTTNTPPVIAFNTNGDCLGTAVTLYPQGLNPVYYVICVLPSGQVSAYPGYGHIPPGGFVLPIPSGGSQYFAFESPGVIASDAEDGDISYKLERAYVMSSSPVTPSVMAQAWSNVTGISIASCVNEFIWVRYTVTDADGNTVVTQPSGQGMRMVVFCDTF